MKLAVSIKWGLVVSCALTPDNCTPFTHPPAFGLKIGIALYFSELMRIIAGALTESFWPLTMVDSSTRRSQSPEIVNEAASCASAQLQNRKASCIRATRQSDMSKA